MEKYFIWGFPGIGKSSVNSELRIVDADCERFKFVLSEDGSDSLHSQKDMEHAQRNPSYPNNYWDHIHSVDADVVLLNCHISLLESLDRENLLLVYPSAALKEEYLQRYTLRGDNGTYIHYMETAFDEMIAAIKNSPYQKYEIADPNIYLQNLIERGTIMEQFITKQELANLLGECIQMGVYTQEGPAAGKTPDELAQMLFDGRLEQGDDAWIFDDAIAAGSAFVDQDARLFGKAVACDCAYVSQGAALSAEARAEDSAYIRASDLCGHARASGHSMILDSPDTGKAPILSETCVVYGTVMGDIHVMGKTVVLSEEKVTNDTLDTLILNGQERSVIRDPSRDELAPHRQQEKQKKPRNKGRDR